MKMEKILFMMAFYPAFILANPCVPPKQSSCMMGNLDTKGVKIEVGFSIKKLRQEVYLDGGCSLRNGKVYKFSSERNLKHEAEERVPSDTVLHFMLCANGELINEQNIPVGDHLKIECNVTKVMSCKSKSLE